MSSGQVSYSDAVIHLFFHSDCFFLNVSYKTYNLSRAKAQSSQRKRFKILLILAPWRLGEEVISFLSDKICSSSAQRLSQSTLHSPPGNFIKSMLLNICLIIHWPSAPHRGLPRYKQLSVSGRLIGDDSRHKSRSFEASQQPCPCSIQTGHRRQSHHSRWVPE